MIIELGIKVLFLFNNFFCIVMLESTKVKVEISIERSFNGYLNLPVHLFSHMALRWAPNGPSWETGTTPRHCKHPMIYQPPAER